MSKGSAVTDAQREHLAALFERWVSSLPPGVDRTNRGLSKILGIDIATLSKIRNRKSVDISTLVRLRAALRRPVDDLLGLDPILPTTAAGSPREDPADPWPNRRDAARFARSRGIPEHVIQSVYKRYADPLFSNRQRAWWGLQFEEAYLVELRQQEEFRAAAEERARPHRAPKKKIA